MKVFASSSGVPALTGGLGEKSAPACDVDDNVPAPRPAWPGGAWPAAAGAGAPCGGAGVCASTRIPNMGTIATESRKNRP